MPPSPRTSSSTTPSEQWGGSVAMHCLVRQRTRTALAHCDAPAWGRCHQQDSAQQAAACLSLAHKRELHPRPALSSAFPLLHPHCPEQWRARLTRGGNGARSGTRPNLKDALLRPQTAAVYAATRAALFSTDEHFHGPRDPLLRHHFLLIGRMNNTWHSSELGAARPCPNAHSAWRLGGPTRLCAAHKRRRLFVPGHVSCAQTGPDGLAGAFPCFSRDMRCARWRNASAGPHSGAAQRPHTRRGAQQGGLRLLARARQRPLAGSEPACTHRGEPNTHSTITLLQPAGTAFRGWEPHSHFGPACCAAPAHEQP